MIESRHLKCAVAGLLLLTASWCKSQSLWDLANQNKELLRISTLFAAQNVRDHLSSEQGISEAIEWCKDTGVTHVFIETYRDNYTAEKNVLENAKSRFKEEGFDVSGCVTTTLIGKSSKGWNGISCYTNKETQDQLQKIFEYTASLFDEIMIDDFLFTDCQCDECKQARGDRSWNDYRCDLMVRVSRDRILAPAKKVNPNARIIIKYPQWYEEFHNRGYEVSRETADYDRIWVGTETRDFNNRRWGGKVQYEAYYILRWLGEIGGGKTGGGWFDPFGTTEDTYLEQARQTVLANAKEMLLFCYGALLRGTGPANIKKLRIEIPGLFELAKLVRNRPIKGIIAPKPPNSNAYNEQYVFDFAGMLGLPLVPTAEIDTDAEAAFFSVHALKDAGFTDKLKKMLANKKPILITDGLAKRLDKVELSSENLTILKVNGDPRSLLKLTRDQLKPIREKLLAPIGIRFDAPNKVALYLIGEDCLIVENFNDEPVEAVLEFSRPVSARKALVLPIDGSVDFSCSGGRLNFNKIMPRTLVALNADFSTVSRMVLTFYYPWYGIPDGPGGAGRTVHWGRIDAANKDIEASTDYPELGAYDSHDPKLIDQHCRWAKDAGIDAFIVSWWGHNHYTDRAMEKILDGCRNHGLSACIYYETVPRLRTPQSAADDIIEVLKKYGKHSAHLKVNDKPVVFVYGRAVQELGLAGWLKAIEIINAEYKEGFTAIGDQFSYGAARVFDGLHTYNTAGHLRGLDPPDARKWAAETYRSWVQLADKAGKISAITVIPGYDDTKIRTPGLAVKRYDGELYRVQWEEAIKADPHWILITSFNEWHEGSEIEPSLEYKKQYMDITAEYTGRFKAKERGVHGPATSEEFSDKEKARLCEKLEGLRIGVLPGADSMGFWWLLDMGVSMELLTWDDVVQVNMPQKYPILLYCAGERYRRTVQRAGDVDDALNGYLKAGGCLVVLPALPWPFYYDQNSQVVNRSSRFGLTLRMGWERPIEGARLHFFQPKQLLPHVPERFPFPTSGDLRWRPFFAGEGAKHTSLLQLCDGDGKYLGDAVAYARLREGGKILYAWFNLLDGHYAEQLLYDIFDLITNRLR